MTKDEVIAKWDGLKSRERDAWVGEVVIEITSEADNSFGFIQDDWRLGENGGWASCVPFYSTDISAAWAVVGAIGDCLHLREHGAAGEWEASFCGTCCDGASGETVQLAICLAALIAKLGSEVGV